ncbi:extracellular solute-binding protein [Cryobacterium sp. TmT2-59]|nr:extracellular solute-binding protein [Cryobacterium sp. TmT2-59]
MKSSMKKMVILTASAVVAMSMAGCSSTPAGDSTGGTITFVTYTGGAAGQKYVDAVAGFEADNPGIKVNLEVVPGDATYDSLVTTRIQGNNAPDIFEVLNPLAGAASYIDAGLLRDLSDQPWVSTLVPGVAAASGVTGGNTYGLVTSLASAGVFYNKDIFEANGLEVPTDWDQFLSAVATLKATGVTPLAVGAKDGWPLMVNAQAMAASDPAFADPGNETAAGLADGSIKFSENDSWKTMVKDFSDLVNAGGFSPDASGVTWPSSAEDFAAGKSAMLIQGDFAIPAIRTANKDINLGYFPLPYVAAGETPAVLSYYQGVLAVPEAAKNSDLALKFLAYLADPNVATGFLTTAAALPTVQGAEPTLDPAVAEILPALQKKSGDSGQSGLTPATNTALQTGLQSILAGNGDVASVLAALDGAQAQ